ncbi:MAG: type II toxin-antitoxin system Phd/YefM family antitoxin [Methylobacillus sp.]|jgi:prevent-host-death family protein|nr:type II toxin-antitoxin system Phd/YefM family antitoxin [Methylobacillus sp.]
MGLTQIKTVTSREFVHNVSAAKRVADEGGTVIITNRGEPTLALIPIAEYQRLTKAGKNIIDALRMPEADAYDIEPIRIDVQGVGA